jgi:hypothetical protein
MRVALNEAFARKRHRARCSLGWRQGMASRPGLGGLTLLSQGTQDSRLRFSLAKGSHDDEQTTTSSAGQSRSQGQRGPEEAGNPSVTERPKAGEARRARAERKYQTKHKTPGLSAGPLAGLSCLLRKRFQRAFVKAAPGHRTRTPKLL